MPCPITSPRYFFGLPQSNEVIIIIIVLQTFPRKIWLDKSGKQLVQWPVEEIETLRTNQVILPATTLKAGSKSEIFGVTGAQV